MKRRTVTLYYHDSFTDNGDNQNIIAMVITSCTSLNPLHDQQELSVGQQRSTILSA
jgi:hypothetical protein